MICHLSHIKLTNTIQVKIVSENCLSICYNDLAIKSLLNMTYEAKSTKYFKKKKLQTTEV